MKGFIALKTEPALSATAIMSVTFNVGFLAKKAVFFWS